MLDKYESKIFDFLIESDKIEGIHLPLQGNTKIWNNRLDATIAFLKSYSITVTSLCEIVKVFEPSAELRNKEGLNVFVGVYSPPKGGKDIEIKLQELLVSIVEGKKHSPFETHMIYESLHPFTDCNGRSGRLLWLWQMINLSPYEWPKLGFLHTYYYQSLQHNR